MADLKNASEDDEKTLLNEKKDDLSYLIFIISPAQGLFCYIIVVPKVVNKLRYQNASKEKRQMHKHYENEFRRKIVQLHIRKDRSIRSLSDEYRVSHGSITSWTTQSRKECEVNEKSKAEYDYMLEN